MTNQSKHTPPSEHLIREESFTKDIQASPDFTAAATSNKRSGSRKRSQSKKKHRRTPSPIEIKKATEKKQSNNKYNGLADNKDLPFVRQEALKPGTIQKNSSRGTGRNKGSQQNTETDDERRIRDISDELEIRMKAINPPMIGSGRNAYISTGQFDNKYFQKDLPVFTDTF